MKSNMKIILFLSILFISFCYAQNECNDGTIQCCNSVQDINSPAVQSLTGLLGLTINDTKGKVGLTCNPISVIGIGGNSCSAQPVCCKGDNFNGLIVLDCNPINLNI